MTLWNSYETNRDAQLEDLRAGHWGSSAHTIRRIWWRNTDMQGYVMRYYAPATSIPEICWCHLPRQFLHHVWGEWIGLNVFWGSLCSIPFLLGPFHFCISFLQHLKWKLVLPGEIKAVSEVEWISCTWWAHMTSTWLLCAEEATCHMD